MRSLAILSLAILLLVAALAPVPAWAQAGTCGPAQIGQPCAVTGPATQADDTPTLTLGAGNPVHIVTGNKTRRDTDLPAAARSPGLEIVRHYNSLDPRGGPWGRGWAGSYDTRLHVVAGLAQIVQADGSRTDFDVGTHPPHHCVPRQTGTGELIRTASGWDWRWPDGRRLAFDAAGRLARIVRPGGGMLHIERHAPPGPLHGLIQTIRDSSGDTLMLHYEIGPPGPRLARVDTPLGAFTYEHTAAPDGRGWLLVAATRPDGMLRRYHYDAARQNGYIQALTGAELVDHDGRVLPLGNWSYDTAGRVATAGEPALRFAYVRPPGPDQPGLTAIDSDAGTTLLHTRVKGTRYVLSHVTGPGCPGCPAPGIQAQYDSAGRLVSLADMRIHYDAQGAVTRLNIPHSGWPGLILHYKNGQGAGWSSTAGGERRLRDPEQNTLERQHVNGDRWTYRHDHRGRPVTLEARSTRPGVAPVTLQLGWRGTRLTHIQSPYETERRRYDAHGRLAARRISRPAVSDAIASIEYEDRYRYDPLGRLNLHKLPEGGTLHYHWQGPRLAGITWTDADGHRHPVLHPIAPDVPGYLHANGLHTLGWTHEGRLVGLRVAAATEAHADADRAPLFAQTLTYDAQGRIARESFFTDGQAHTLSYAYDTASRLIIAATHDSAQQHYAWRSDGSARHAAPLKRDASGLPIAVAQRDLHHNALHYLQRVQHDGRILLQQHHDAQGRRIMRQDDDAVTHYLYADNRLAAEIRTVHGVTGVTRRYIHVGWSPIALIDYATPQPLNGVARPASRAAALYAIHSDAIGLPRVVTDQTGKVRWRARFDALGRAEHIEGDLTLDLRLPGQVYDAATGWHDNGLRTYDPVAGHYLQADPLGPLPGNQAYGYAAQQPRRHADPLGLLLFAFDGTRNTPASLTNVWLLGQAYADGAVHYHPGPGDPDTPIDRDTLTAHSAPLILATQWERLLADLSAVRFAAEPMQIDLLGFSRGAALARHFSNLIAQRVRNGRFWLRDQTLGTITACVGLRFIGLFDTVAQFGLRGSNNDEYDFAIAEAWHWVAHAVALHEFRRLFPLTSLEGSPGAHIIEAPFVGAHADIGGGYLAESGMAQGDLSNVALAWMRWQARAAGVAIDELPKIGRAITRPIVHDERLHTAPGTLSGNDRAVLDADSDRLLEQQRDHPRYGTAARRDVSAFIARLPLSMVTDTSAVARVDMDAYRQWLARELGFDHAP